jgi:4-hydroxybenzoate polyprenyltransferase/phosphoserine phosphatase
MHTGTPVPLCIDLDGTLIRSDTLVESLLLALKEAPWLAFAMPLWLAGGRAGFKARMAQQVRVDPDTLPYRHELVDWARLQANERPVVLVTAAHRSIAEGVAAHLGFFNEVIATDGQTNLKGSRKADALLQRFGAGAFDYAGNDRPDLAVWKNARTAIVVGAGPALTQAARSVARVEHEFDPAPTALHRAKAWIRALRLYQWVKNLLIFLAPAASHTIFEPAVLMACLIAFLSFGLAASGVYLLNDLLDLASDRRHPRKRRRPFASGALPLWAGMAVAPVLLLASFVIAVTVNATFTAVLAAYVVITIAYSLWAKTKTFLDVATLASLYSVRVAAGAAAAGIGLSFWLLAVCVYGFLGLALLKRYSELVGAEGGPRDRVAGRGYARQDIPVVLALGVGSSLVATLVTALYIDSQAGHKLYANPQLLWALVGLMLLGVGRLWLVAGRGEMHDDPIVYIARDRWSLGLLALATGVTVMAL